MNNKKDYSDDDGKVYADMSALDDISPKLSLNRKPKKKKEKLDSQGYPIKDSNNPIKLTKEEKREIAKGVIKAHLLYALMGIILLCLVFFIIFKLWLR